MFCKKCGSEIDDDSLFCYKCAAPVTRQINIESKTQNEDISAESPVKTLHVDNMQSPINNEENAPILGQIPSESQNDHPSSDQIHKSNLTIKKKIKLYIIMVSVLCVCVLSGVIIFKLNNDTVPRTFNNDYSMVYPDGYLNLFFKKNRETANKIMIIEDKLVLNNEHWCATFLSSVESLYIELPKDVRPGDIFIIDSNDPVSAANARATVIYTLYKNNNVYKFGIPSGDKNRFKSHYSSKITITISTWESEKQVTGTIRGAIYTAKDKGSTIIGAFKADIENLSGNAEYGNIKVDINGVTTTFLPQTAFEPEFGSSKCYSQYKSDYKYVEISFFTCPTSGFSMVRDTQNVNVNESIIDPCTVSFHRNGHEYTFDYEETDDGVKIYSSKISLHVDKWEGSGGFAYGTFEGEMYITKDNVIRFSNGTFKIKIA